MKETQEQLEKKIQDLEEKLREKDKYIKVIEELEYQADQARKQVWVLHDETKGRYQDVIRKLTEENKELKKKLSNPE